jgi:D-beta-D-heptose 7-phosphate kinase/D-beta-D-heptose 1-phosphate adenosyltransferase
VDCTERIFAPGGAANAAVSLRSLGAQVSLLSLRGDDAEGEVIAELLRERDIDTEHLLCVPGRKTLCKQRICADSQLVVRLDQGDTGAPPEPIQTALRARLSALMRRCDAVLLSDYGYGALSPELIQALAQAQRRSPAMLVGDSKDLNRFGELAFKAVKPNYGQALALLGETGHSGPARVDHMLRLGPRIFERLNTEMVALTLDQDGALVFERGRPPLRTHACPNPHSQAAGAGDTYISALTLALVAGADTQQAAEIAAAAAAVVVGKDGTSACELAELARRLNGHYSPCDHCLDCLLPQLRARRQGGQRIVLTNGCFDILHRGHVAYLNQARDLGDALVVGLNSDESIRRLKGRERPINGVEDRAQVLAALRCVDHVVVFDEDTPHRLVEAIRPDIFVKGGDYTRERLPEAALVEQYGGRVEILPLVRERSTTTLISRIRSGESPPNGKHAPLPAGRLILHPAGSAVS